MWGKKLSVEVGVFCVEILIVTSKQDVVTNSTDSQSNMRICWFIWGMVRYNLYIRIWNKYVKNGGVIVLVLQSHDLTISCRAGFRWREAPDYSTCDWGPSQSPPLWIEEDQRVFYAKFNEHLVFSTFLSHCFYGRTQLTQKSMPVLTN